MHDDAESIRSKIKKAWCESGMTEANPLLEIARQIIFHENKEITVERPEKFGGNVTYTGFGNACRLRQTQNCIQEI